jgi:arylamine N-acetyltransferase
MMVARAEPNGRRVAILNDELKRRERDGHAEVARITSERQLRQVLEQDFEIELPASPRLAGRFS